jgi:membrane dipeptidase
MTKNTSAAFDLYNSSIKIDLQLGFEPEIEAEYKWDTLNHFLEQGFNLASLAMSTDNTSLASTIQFFAAVRTRLKQHSDKYIIVESTEDIHRAKKEKKLGITFLLQGPNPLDKNLDMLEVYYTLGVRSIILAYNIRNPFADGCIEPNDAGLSRLGQRLIRQMNELGLVVDCSHTGYRSSMEAIELSESPVIFSHSNVYALHPHPRNLKDDQIKAIAQKGGLIGINGNAGLLGEKNASIKKFVEHIDYITQLIGPEYVALGTDQVYFPELFNSYMKKQEIFYSLDYQKGIDVSGLSYIKPEQIIDVVQALINLGYNQKDIQGILGDNYLQLLNKVWK